MNSPQRPTLRLSSPAELIAVIPHLLGFTPQASLVVVGVGPQDGRVRVTFRYDLPDPPDPTEAAAIVEHAIGVLSRQQVTLAVVIGYGPGPLVTPLADAVRQAAPGAGVALHDVLRVHEGRFWSYICRDPSCCPAEGVPVDASDPAARALAAAGLSVLPDRAALAATLAPVTGPDAEAMVRSTRRALRDAVRLAETEGPRALDRAGLSAVQVAVAACRNGRPVSRSRHAWLSVLLTRLPVRDDAWARMDPAHRDAHSRLWTGLGRRA
jgi:Domain of unknown function (DUF4192)